MEISALGFLLVLASTGLLAVSNPGSRRELDADIHGMQDGYFMDSPGGWRMDNDEDPWTHWGDNGYLSGATNLVAYSDSKPSIENVQPSFEHHLQDSKPSIEKVQPSFEHHLQIDIMLFKIYDEVKMFELVELEPNSTESRCLDCCTPTPYDPKRPIMRREERASTRDQPLRNVSVTIWTEVVASSMEVNRTGLLRKSLHPNTDRCSHCCLLSVVQKVKRLDANDS